LADGLQLRGIITALVTPFSSAGDVDEAALREIVEFQVRNRVNGLFPLGTTGMGPAMEPEERKRVAEIVVETVNGKIPVIIQVGSADPLTSLDLAKHAEKIGADAIASLNPFYYHPSAESVIEHYRRLSEATTLPIIAYNIPSNTGNNIEPKLLLQISKIPRLIGIKDSSRDFMQMQDYMATLPESFNIINGADAYQFSAFCAGIKAGVSATANAIPDFYVEMHEAYKSGHFEKGKDLQKKIFLLRKAMVNPAIAPFLEVLRMRGVRSGNVRPPFRALTQAEIDSLRAVVNSTLPELKLVA